jgi:hypothetical protein
MLAALTNILPKPLKALAIRFDRSRIDNVEALTEFVRTRASYVAQTSLYGYLKTRMGTQFRTYFEDPMFSASIREAAVRLFVSCLGDLTVYAVAITARDARLAAPEAETLARHCFEHGMDGALADVPPDMLPAGAAEAFAARTASVHWAGAADGPTAFAGSQEDIVRFAPVVDEFKELDREIVSNSIRFRWRDVREQLRKRIDAEGVCADWRNRIGGNGTPEA